MFVFIFVITPVSLILRLFRVDPLNLRMGVSSQSHWSERSERSQPSHRFKKLS